MVDKSEQKALDDIAEHGCHILQVMEEAGSPPFSYSIGVNTTLAQPDLCVIGLKEPLAKFVINEYVFMLKEGKAFEPGIFYPNFLEGYKVCFEEVATEFFPEYFGWAMWYYRGPEFSMRQLIYPTTSGIYPWDLSAPQDFLDWQPILTATRKAHFHDR